MADTPGRMLELLSLLQVRRSWGGAELAARLEITERTVRRDIERLRLLGYPVEAVPGRYGGYELGRGGRLPPLLLNDDEAAAVAIGLRSAIDGSVAGLEEPAVSALAKLDQLLPAHVASRVRSLHESTASMLWGGPRERIDAAHLIVLAHACSAQERVRFGYTDKGGKGSRRLVEPLRLVRSGSRWYLVARDVDRAAWRTFRLDRIKAPESVGTRFDLHDPPDPVEMVTQGLTVATYPYRARIRLPLPVEEATRIVPRSFAVLEGDGGTTVVELGSTSLERMVAYLAGLHPPCDVLDPPELRRALRDHAQAVASANH
jgi:predicted DNA-binding transcriptional regulator YafY